MENVPRHSGPSRQTYNIREPSYANFLGTSHLVRGGTISITYQSYPSDELGELEKHCSRSAPFDSSARFDPPRCAESTRVGIIRIIESWVYDASMPSSLFWLHGGAGVGKTALAQSLSEKFQQQDQLAASFFFFRGDSTRNNSQQLIPTLVSHLVRTIKELSPFVEEKIRENPALFADGYEVQIQKLLVEPLLALKSKVSPETVPQLVVIDGLDACENADVQCQLLSAVARAIPQIPYPLRFFIISRPEAHIMRIFNHDPDFQAILVHRYNLSDDPDADMDIRKFLERELMEIRRVHRLGHYLPNAWPDRKVIASLVERSSGHFLYASTVIRYISSPRHRPDDRLQVALGLQPPQEGDRPYGQLDALHALIFDRVESYGQLEKICLVLGILYVRSKAPGFFSLDATIEELLDMKSGDLVSLLDPILSLVAIDDDNIRILHKSLMDYLLDPTRGGHLPFDLARVHEAAATYILQQRILKYVCSKDDFRLFAFHCRYAHLNDILKDFLRSLEVPCPKYLMSIIEISPSESVIEQNQDLILAPWSFFRILSREDFDSTGKLYEQYMAKWTSYLGVALPGRTVVGATAADRLKGLLKPRNRVSVGKVEELKRKLDTMFMNWNLERISVGVTLVRRDNRIKREHSVLSAFTEALYLGETNTIASSLIFHDYFKFVHSYSFGFPDDGTSFLIVRTYSRYSDACHQLGYFGTFDIAQQTESYLRVIETYFGSKFFQKYGLNPDDVASPM